MIFFIFGLARLTWICNPLTDSETSFKVMRYWKFSQKSKLKQNFFLIVKKKWEIFFKTGTIVIFLKSRKIFSVRFCLFQLSLSVISSENGKTYLPYIMTIPGINHVQFAIHMSWASITFCHGLEGLSMIFASSAADNTQYGTIHSTALRLRNRFPNIFFFFEKVHRPTCLSPYAI